MARFRGVGFNLLSKLADEHSEVFGLFDVVAAPDGRQERPVSENFPVVAQEIREQIEFLRREMNFAAFDAHGASVEIELKFPGAQHAAACGFRLRRAPERHSHAGRAAHPSRTVSLRNRPRPRRAL